MTRDEQGVSAAGTVEALAKALHAEPMFHFSLGSKELFHSNLLAWFVDKYPSEAREVFADWTTRRPGMAGGPTLREHRDLDLVVRLVDHEALVVENKVLSMPDENQLLRYGDGPVSVLPGAPSCVLLSLADPHWEGDRFSQGQRSWRRVGYDELRRRLSAVVDRVKSRDAYDGGTLEHYCAMIQQLCDLNDFVDVKSANEPVDLANDVAHALGQSRISSLARKLRMRQVESRLRERLSAFPDVRVRSGFTDGDPLIEAFVPLDEKDRVGWQYQRGQFRLAMQLQSNAAPVTRSVREDYARSKYDAWFDTAKLEERLGGVKKVKARIAAGGFNGYKPDFVYRYRRPTSFSVGQLLDVGHQYIVDAVGRSARPTRMATSTSRTTSLIVAPARRRRLCSRERKGFCSSTDTADTTTSRKSRADVGRRVSRTFVVISSMR